MIDFTDYKYGTKLNMILSDDKSNVQISAIVDEISWSHNRKPFLANLIINESADTNKWPNNSKITLEVKCDNEKEQSFLLECPKKLGTKILSCKAKINLN